MAKFHYEYYLIKIETATGVYEYEFKARNRESAINQIKKYADDCKKQNETARTWLERADDIKTIMWDTLTLDRTGHDRRF